MNRTCDETIDEALTRSVVYRALSLAFQAPSPERIAEIGAADGFPIVASALSHAGRGPGASDLARSAARLAAVPLPGAASIAADFVRLFGHTARGRVPVCETEYGHDNAFHQPQQLADVAGYYLAFGLRPAAASEARVDHIACELEFMDFLNRKQAWLAAHQADTSDDTDTCDATLRAERTFLRDHLARFGRAFARRVIVEDGDGYYGALGHALLAWLTADCARLGVEAGPVDLIVRSDADDDTPMACGSSDELIQIQRK